MGRDGSLIGQVFGCEASAPGSTSLTGPPGRRV
jgi:hypothetical protein